MTRGPRPILNPDQIEQMADMRERGWTIVRIATYFTERGTPVSCGSIQWQCLRVGADLPVHKRRRSSGAPGRTISRAGSDRSRHSVTFFSPEEDARLVEMDKAGVRVCDIARELGRQPNSVRGRLMILSRLEARAEEMVDV
jgi:hypothetical protein